MYILLKPTDVLMFRDGRPFNQGEQHTARTVFPPSPRTIHGALRAQMLRHAGLSDAEARRCMKGDRVIQRRLAPSLAALVGDATTTGGFRVAGVFGFRDIGHVPEVLLPAPLDLALPSGRDEGGGRRWSRMLPARNPSPVRVSGCGDGSPLPHPLATLDGRSGDPPTGCLIPSGELKAYLTDPGGPVELLEEKDLVGRERRTGLKLEDGRAEEGMLFEVEFLRFGEGYGLIAGIEATSEAAVEGLEKLAAAPGVLRLGGEGRLARFEVHAHPFLGALLGEAARKELCERLTAGGKTVHLSVYLATDSCWVHAGREGWHPARLLEGFTACGASNPRLLGAAVGKYSVQGGWALVSNDAAMGEPRSRFAAVPAGSVYHLALEGNYHVVERIVQELHGKALSDRDSEYGFGLAFVGVSDGSRI